MAAFGSLVPSGQPDLANGASEGNDAKITAAIAKGQELAQKGDFSKALRITLDVSPYPKSYDRSAYPVIY